MQTTISRRGVLVGAATAALSLPGISQTASALAFDDGDDIMRFGERDQPTDVRSLDPTAPIHLPTGQLNIDTMDTGIAVFIIGTLGLVFAAIWATRARFAGVVWGVAFIILIMAGTLGLGMELFWMAILAAVLVLVVEMVVRWS